MRVGVYQCELEHLHQAPHLAGCLFASDLRLQGHQVTQAMVHPSGLEEWVADLEEDQVDLALCDAIFPFPLLRAAREGCETAILVGGHNALQHILRGPADLAIVGAGRAAVRALGLALLELEKACIQLLGGSGAHRRCVNPKALPYLEQVPNLWFWRLQADGSATLDCGPLSAAGSPAADVLPFHPELKQEYYGPSRKPSDDFYIPSVVAELGCLYDAPPRRSDALRDTAPRVPAAALTRRAAERIQQDFLQRAGGCSFCVFRTLPNAREPRRDAARLVAEQLSVLAKSGAKGASLQTENPIPLLLPLLDELEARGLRPDPLHIRTIPWLLLKQEDQLRQAAARAQQLGIHIHLTQVGFETFHGPDLDLFNKGISAADNLRAAELLHRLDRELRPTFRGVFGHGMILLHPWTSLEGLRDNLAAVRAEASFLQEDLGPESRLALYSEVLPLFWKAHDDGLVEQTSDEFGWSWRYADPTVASLVDAWAGGISLLRKRWEGASAGLLSQHGHKAGLAAAMDKRKRRLELQARPALLEGLLDLADEGACDPESFRLKAQQICDEILA